MCASFACPINSGIVYGSVMSREFVKVTNCSYYRTINTVLDEQYLVFKISIYGAVSRTSTPLALAVFGAFADALYRPLYLLHPTPQCTHSRFVARRHGQKSVPFVFRMPRCILTALSPFRKPIVLAKLHFGGTLNNMWMWSDIAFPSRSSIPPWPQRSLKISPN